MTTAEEFFGGLEWKASGPGPGAFFVCGVPIMNFAVAGTRYPGGYGACSLHHRQRPLCQAPVAERPVALPPVRQRKNDMAESHQIRTMQNGNDWYWEVTTRDREVIAHGVAGTRAEALAAAEIAASQDTTEIQTLQF